MDEIYIGNFSKGLTTSRLPFNIDNDAFPTMFNFYSWRGRAKRKRGTYLLGQLQRQLQSSASPNAWQLASLNLIGGAGNLIITYSLGSTASITPGSISLVGGTDGTTYTDPSKNGTLLATGGTGTGGTINYATGAITITAGSTETLIGTFSYFPGLPSMGNEDYIQSSILPYPVSLDFDTKYAYQINQNSDANIFFYSVSYYKATNNPVVWTGQNYQQFWTTNYQGALWAVNNNPGMQFEPISTIGVGAVTTITTSIGHGLVTGDYVFFNEITGTDSSLLNGISSIIVVTTSTTFTVAIDTTGKVINNTGIFQTLTAKSTTSTGDGIKWYDGDMTSSTGIPTTTSTGWVNFAPPLTATTIGIVDLPADLYYLVGALAILPFKDRILFFSPYVQTSSGTPILLQDTIIFSWNGTPYYSNPVPDNQTYDVTGYYVDVTGKGGYLSAGIDQNIVTLTSNEDVILVGFTGIQTRLVYTGNDFTPFLFFNINSELGSSSTFSGVSLDKGGLSIGTYGISITTQQGTQRIDLDIPDSVFQIQAKNNGAQRVNSARDFYKEWIYFSYPTGDGNASAGSWVFPSQTFLYNYRDNTWGIFRENFTSHGTFRIITAFTWANSRTSIPTWNSWREPWNSGSFTSQFPSIIAGNPQGYILVKGQGTGEGPSGSIKALATANSGSQTQITSINHCVNQGDYLQITGCLGTTSINTLIGMVTSTADANTFVIDLSFPSGTYLGLGKYTRLSQPLLQTKQFPVYWDQGRQVRLGRQQYLMDSTASAQVTVNIYLSQDPNTIWNSGSIVPTITPQPTNNSLIYSQLMYTCSESINLGLTPANKNLQMPTAQSQKQIWHRFNTSLTGDSIQIGITLSDAQMRILEYATAEITLHGMNLTTYPAGMLA